MSLPKLAGGRVVIALAAILVVIGTSSGRQPHTISASAKEGAESGRLDETAKKAVEDWAGAVASGNVDNVREILAPEFQILRSDGKAYDKAQYLAGGMSKIAAIYSVQDVVATEHGKPHGRSLRDQPQGIGRWRDDAATCAATDCVPPQRRSLARGRSRQLRAFGTVTIPETPNGERPH